MNEIDDEFKNREEETDQGFLEKFDKGKSGEEVLNEYQNVLKKMRAERERQYVKYLREKKKAVWKKKKEKKKSEKFKHLEIKHFEFEFSSWEKFWIWFDTFKFNLKRDVMNKIWRILPTFVIYHYYKFIKELKVIWAWIVEHYENGRDYLFAKTVKFSVKFWAILKKLSLRIWKLSKKAFSRLMFWKKGEKSDEDSEGKGKEGEEGVDGAKKEGGEEEKKAGDAGKEEKPPA